jgi:hypothetical protein
MADMVITGAVDTYGTLVLSSQLPEESTPITFIYDDNEWYGTEKISIALITSLIRDRASSLRDIFDWYAVNRIILRQDIDSTNKHTRTVLNKTDLSILTRKYMDYLATAFPNAVIEYECSEDWLNNRVNIDIITSHAYPVRYEDIKDNAIAIGDYVCATGMARSVDPFSAPWKWLRPVKVVNIGGINSNDITVEESNGTKVTYPRHVITKFHRIDYAPVAGGKLVCVTAPGRKIPLYGNSTSVDSDDSIDTNKLYFYDGKAVNYKYRVVINKSDVGRVPATQYSIGWVSENDLAMYGITQEIEE